MLLPNRISTLFCIAVMGVAGCDLTSPTDRSPADIDLVAGDSQTVAVGLPVSVPPSIRVLDSQAKPLGGVEVIFSVTKGGGSVAGATTVTDASGVASVGSWTIGTVPGSNTLLATVGSLSATFAAVGVAGPVASVSAVNPAVQNVTVKTTVPNTPAVLVKDTYGNAIANTQVIFSIGSGAGSVTGSTTLTDATGIATVGGWTIGEKAGINTLVATAGSVTVIFNAVGLAGPPSSIAPLTPATQNAAVNTVVPTAPSVVVKDVFGNPVPGIQVTFSATPTSSVVAGPSQLTNAAGIATVESWTLGKIAGSYALTATAASLTTTFDAIAIAGPPAALLPLAGNDQVSPANSRVAVSPTVAVRDAFDNPVANVPVTFSVGSTGGTVTGASQTTNSDGLASVGSWTLGSASGEYSLNAATGSLAAAFSATAIATTMVAGRLRFSMVSSGAVAQGGGAHTCAMDVGGHTFCWGLNDKGQLGNGTTISSPSPVPVSGSHTFTWITGGFNHTCALDTAGKAFCWGSNSSSQLGGASFGDRSVPMEVSGGLTFKSLSAGGNSTCGVTTAGKAYCWGSNFLGVLGIGDATQATKLVPTAVASNLAFASVVMGHAHACAVTLAGKAYCWGGGSPYWGQLGIGIETVPDPRPADDPLFVRSRAAPTPVLGEISFSRLAAASFNTCGLDALGKAYCWGANTAGQVGDGTTTNRGAPAPVSAFTPFASISVGEAHACGRLAGGSLRCWGANSSGQFGNGAAVGGPTPTDAGSGLAFATVAAGRFHTCGVDFDGKVFCWGNNQFGQLGDGTTTNRARPTEVIFP